MKVDKKYYDLLIKRLIWWKKKQLKRASNFQLKEINKEDLKVKTDRRDWYSLLSRLTIFGLTLILIGGLIINTPFILRDVLGIEKELAYIIIPTFAALAFTLLGRLFLPILNPFFSLLNIRLRGAKYLTIAKNYIKNPKDKNLTDGARYLVEALSTREYLSISGEKSIDLVTLIKSYENNDVPDELISICKDLLLVDIWIDGNMVSPGYDKQEKDNHLALEELISTSPYLIQFINLFKKFNEERKHGLDYSRVLNRLILASKKNAPDLESLL